MAMKEAIKPLTKTSAKSPAKTNRPKARAAPLSTGKSSKTTPARPASRKARPVKRRTRANAKPSKAMKRRNSLREQTIEKSGLERSIEAIEGTRHPAAAARDRLDDPTGRTTAFDQNAAEALFSNEEIRAKSAEGLRVSNKDSEPAGVAAHQPVLQEAAMPHVAGPTLMPMRMMAQQQASAFALMLQALHMQRQFFQMWSWLYPFSPPKPSA